MKVRVRTYGTILVMSALFTVMLYVLAMALFRILPMEFHHARKSRQDVAAHYAGEAGIKNAVAWLEIQSSVRALTPEVLDADFNSAYAEPVSIGPLWAYTARIDINPGGFRYFDITARAYFRGLEVRDTLVTIERKNFARYALFIDTWPEDLIYGLGSEGVRGPFHTNGFFRLAVPDPPGPALWTTPGEPFVAGQQALMTHARIFKDDTLPFPGDGNAYYGGNTEGSDQQLVPYDTNGPIESRYEKIVQGGSGNIQVVDDVIMPTTVSDFLLKAWDEDSTGPLTLPGEFGVFVNADAANRVQGGVYVQGDAEMTLEIDDVGNQVQKFGQETYSTAYRWEEEIEVEVPVYEQQIVSGLVPELLAELCTRTVMVQTGTISEVVVNANGMTETVEVPVYEEQEKEYVCYVPTGNMIESEHPVWVQVGTEMDTAHVPHYVSEEEYQANPDTYPDAYPFVQPAGESFISVVEVTEDEGYTIPAGSSVNGEPSDGEFVGPGNTVVYDEDSGEYLLYEGDLNGITFVNGSIESLSGISKGSAGTNEFGEEGFEGRTIVANADWDRTVNITGDLLQFYAGDDPDRRDPDTPFALKRGEPSPNGEHALGLIAGNILLKPASKAGVLDVHAVVLAGRTLAYGNGNLVRSVQDPTKAVTRGGFGVHEDVRNSPGQGQFRLVGGIIEAHALPWLTGTSGLVGELIYDPAMARGLRDFPLTQDFTVLRYVERPVGG